MSRMAHMYHLKVVYADDPESNYNIVVGKCEIVRRFPFLAYVLALPELTHVTVVYDLTAITIKEVQPE